MELVYRLFLIAVAFMASTCGRGGSEPPAPSPSPTAIPGPRMLDGPDPASGLPRAVVQVRGEDGRVESLTVEIASTPEQRQLGLMHREALAEDRGMVFLFPADTTTGFWMKDTLVPLDIAFLAADGSVIGIREGVPLSTAIVGPGSPYRFVLEVNRGWFERHGLGAGAVVALPPSGLPTAR